MHSALGEYNTKNDISIHAARFKYALNCCFFFHSSIFNSQEEIESLRDKMAAHTSLVVVGSADDSLRMRKMNRQTDSVTQPMIDNMVMVC